MFISVHFFLLEVFIFLVLQAIYLGIYYVKIVPIIQQWVWRESQCKLQSTEDFHRMDN